MLPQRDGEPPMPRADLSFFDFFYFYLSKTALQGLPSHRIFKVMCASMPPSPIPGCASRVPHAVCSWLETQFPEIGQVFLPHMRRTCPGFYQVNVSESFHHSYIIPRVHDTLYRTPKHNRTSTYFPTWNNANKHQEKSQYIEVLHFRVTIKSLTLAVVHLH